MSQEPHESMRRVTSNDGFKTLGPSKVPVSGFLPCRLRVGFRAYGLGLRFIVFATGITVFSCLPMLPLLMPVAS